MEYPRDLKKKFTTVFRNIHEEKHKSFQVKDIMSPNVMTTDPKTSMNEAAKIMGEKRIGSLVVMVEGIPRGIVTERDLLSEVLARKLDPGGVSVSSVMSIPLVSISPDATVKEAAKMMTRRRSRLVVLEDDRLAGIITASDLIKVIPNIAETEAGVSKYMTKEVVMLDHSTPLIKVVETMGVERIGSVIVTSNGEPRGIFTERDLLTSFLSRGRSLDIDVGFVASSPIIFAPVSITIYEAAYVMAFRHIKRLPLFEDEKIVGIITARDLVEAYSI